MRRLSMRFGTAGDVAKQTFDDFSDDKVVQLSAALAYNAIFALAPLLLVIVGVAGLVMGQDTVRQSRAGPERHGRSAGGRRRRVDDGCPSSGPIDRRHRPRHGRV